MHKIRKIIDTGLPENNTQALDKFKEIVRDSLDVSNNAFEYNTKINDEKIKYVLNDLVEDLLFQLERVYSLVIDKGIVIDSDLKTN